MNTNIKITTILETCVHNGYCSNNEFYYESNEKVFILETPQKYIDYPIGIIENYDEEFIVDLLPIPEINMNGSYYCKNSKESELKDDCKYQNYTYNIKTVEIITNDK